MPPCKAFFNYLEFSTPFPTYYLFSLIFNCYLCHEQYFFILIFILDKVQYIAGFKRYSTERVMKSLVGEFTQNEKWSVKGTLMGECWYKDCCVSEHPDSLRCGKPEIEDGDEKMRMLIRSEEVQRLMRDITLKE